MIPYALGLPETYSITVKGHKNPIVLHKAEKLLGPYWDYLQYCQDQLCIEYMEDKKTALMTIESFNYYSWNNLQVFVDFVDQNFKEMEDKGIKNLIIDVRFNGGGSQSAAIHLLKYLVDKPFTYYSKAEYAGKIGKAEGKNSSIPWRMDIKGRSYF